MATEESPLLATHPATPSKDIYDRFSHAKKRVILTIVSIFGLLPLLVSGCFIPSISQISKDLNATPAAVSLGVSLSVLANSFSVIFWSSYSSFYGRRVIYIAGMPLFICGSFAVAASTNLNGLLFWRFVQTFGCAAGNALGAATIGDIYRVEERGTAMGTFLGATLLGLALAPPLGGIMAQYWSWRGFQAILGIWGVIHLLLIVFFFPETAHPGTRGIDKAHGQRKLFTWINPFRCLALLRSPNIMAITLANTFSVLTEFTLLTPISSTIAAKYGITSEGLIGLIILPSGVGNFVGAPISGYISDWVLQQAKQKRNGVWIPEDRLRGVWLGALLLMPISMVLAGFTTTYVDGTLGLAICLVCLFFNGAGVDMALTPIGAYSVDIMPSRGAEVMAAMVSLRSLLLTPASALCIPSVETIGVAATNSIAAMFALFGYVLVWLTIRYGKQMRAYVDVGYPDFDARA